MDGVLRTLLAAILVAAALAGCSSGPKPAAPAADVPAGPAVQPLPTYAYDCPPGGTAKDDAGLCWGRIASPTEALREPWVALDPADPSTMAIAVNGDESFHLVGGADATQTRTIVYVTKDSGATWEATRPPAVGAPRVGGAVGLTASYDPTIAFDAEGRLHLAGMVSNDGGARNLTGVHNVPFYTSTPDLGATWTDPVVLDDRFGDRPFLAAGPGGRVAVVWAIYTSGGPVAALVGSRATPGYAWSLDGGQTWREQDLAAQGCDYFGPIAFQADQAVVACGYGGPVLRFDDNGTGHPIGTLPEDAGMQLGLLPGGGMVVGSNTRPITGAYSPDGRTWGPVTNLQQASPLLEGRQSWLAWFGTDPWGGVHAMVRVGEAPECFNGLGGPPGGCRLVHAIFDPRDWSLVQASNLLPPVGSVPEGASVVGPKGQSGDDYYAFAFGPDDGVLAWTRDDGIDFTRVVPSG